MPRLTIRVWSMPSPFEFVRAADDGVGADQLVQEALLAGRIEQQRIRVRVRRRTRRAFYREQVLDGRRNQIPAQQEVVQVVFVERDADGMAREHRDVVHDGDDEAARAKIDRVAVVVREGDELRQVDVQQIGNCFGCTRVRVVAYRMVELIEQAEIIESGVAHKQTEDETPVGRKEAHRLAERGNVDALDMVDDVAMRLERLAVVERRQQCRRSAFGNQVKIAELVGAADDVVGQEAIDRHRAEKARDASVGEPVKRARTKRALQEVEHDRIQRIEVRKIVLVDKAGLGADREGDVVLDVDAERVGL